MLNIQSLQILKGRYLWLMRRFSNLSLSYWLRLNTLLYSCTLWSKQHSKIVINKGGTSMFFYGGEIHCMLGKMKQENLDKVLDLMDEYIELVESLEEVNHDRSSSNSECPNKSFAK